MSVSDIFFLLIFFTVSILIGFAVKKWRTQKDKPTGSEGFRIIDDGCEYSLPLYQVIDGKGLVMVKDTGQKNDPFQRQIIRFVRGSKLNADSVPRRKGTRHEDLLAMQIYDLNLKNELVPCRETAKTIKCLEKALYHLHTRQEKRKKRNVHATYHK